MAEENKNEQPAQPNPERKTLDDRAKMTELERIRHSCAHVMATAILRLWPDAQFAYGPPVENGFYYDMELSHRIAPEDFEKIEAEMKKEIKANNTFEKMVVTRDQAIADAQSGRLGGLGERPGNASKFKLDLLKQIPEGEAISYYKNGDFIDLCAGPHVMRTGNVGAFKLTSVAAAYYKGDEKGPQLQRIYGTAFKNKTEMEAYFNMIEEAKKRDHRKIGAEMGLFAIDTEFVGPGMPLWLPKGTVLVEELEKLAKETEFAAGYVRVRTPHLAREKMYKTSGHLPYYAESMFPPMILDELAKERNELKIKIPPLERQLIEFAEKETGESTDRFAQQVGPKQPFQERALEVASFIIEGGDAPEEIEKSAQRMICAILQKAERNGTARCLLPQGDELSAPPPHLCGGAEELSGFTIASGGIWHLLSL